MEIKPIDPEFVRVWSRVKGEPSAPGPVPAPQQDSGEWGEFLTGKIRAELHRWQDYCALGLAGPAQDSRSRVKKLSAAWFFRSGERYLPRVSGLPTRYPNRLEGVRRLYQSEQLSEQDYRQAGEACGDDELRPVFEACARSCQETRRRLWQLAEKGF